MRSNLPVTQREYDFPADATLMSTTDTQSHINYANAAFVSVSGFERSEIMGQPHNMVRHPDMPTQAFGDMWSTLKAGKSWTALVKNRRKNGDHYWVRANATPIIRGGQVTGYMSVRTKPSRDEIAGAEALYREFRENRAGNKAFHQGLIFARAGCAGPPRSRRCRCAGASAWACSPLARWASPALQLAASAAWHWARSRPELPWCLAPSRPGWNCRLPARWPWSNVRRSASRQASRPRTCI
ncbi:MAG: PAS domain-containing protein [Burkholderiales bacterium]|nr:PAS domain-containing protein [Burkholderiales bacterium]